MSYDERADFADKRKYVADFFEMLQPFNRDTSGWRTLEVGGEGGMLAGLMAQRVGHIVGTDIVNSQMVYQGGMGALLHEKFRRNGEDLPLDKLEFLTADAQDLPFRDDWFDFCFSQNAFEHIPDPEKAQREMVRVTRPGGLFYLMFDPLWTADSGSHFLHYIGDPWAHLIESDDKVARRMATAGASAAEIASYRGHMNRLPLAYYREMFTRVTEDLGVKILIRHEWSGCVDENFVRHPNLAAAASAHGVDENELLVRGLRFLLEV
jgi:ubiquinone/menaquinone biosynthesis C-methylase UbiE